MTDADLKEVQLVYLIRDLLAQEDEDYALHRVYRAIETAKEMRADERRIAAQAQAA